MYTMALEGSQVQVVDNEYQNYETAEATAVGSQYTPPPPPTYENTRDSGGETAVLPLRYQVKTAGENTLAEDLRRTANGTSRRTRRTTRRTPHYKIDADTEFSDDSSIDEGYEVDSILSSIDERLT